MTRTLDTKNMRVIDVSQKIMPAKAPIGPDDFVRLVLEEALVWPIEQYGSYVDDSIYQIVKLKTHLKTHIEAPYHLDGKGKFLSDFPPETFFGRMVFFNLLVSPGAWITREMLSDADRSRLKHGDIAVVHTDWDRTLSAEKPLFTEDGAKYLYDKGIKMFGQDDSFSISKKDAQESAHDFFLRNDIPLLEMLCNLDQLAQDVSFLIAIPGLLKIQGIDASTVQAVVLEGFDVI